MKKRYFLAAALAIFSAEANAKCINGQETVFHCTTETKKIIQVCKHRDTFTYSFGKSSAAEIVLEVDQKRIRTRGWDGMGRWESYGIGIPSADGGTTYAVFWARDRNADGVILDAGVHVEKKGKHVATVQCDANLPITQTLSPGAHAANEVATTQTQAPDSKTALLKRFDEKCEAVLPFDLINKIDDRIYFGRTYWSGQGFNGPAVVIYQGGKALPTSAGRRLIFAPSKLGETKITLQGGGEVIAKVYGSGDKECTAMAEAIHNLPR